MTDTSRGAGQSWQASRKALEAEQAQAVEPVAWLVQGELTDLVSCNGMSIWAESPSAWFDEKPAHLVPVFKHSPDIEAQQVTAPVGYVLVPIEPTEEMIDASRCYSDKCGEYMIKATPIGHYRAMLAAAQGAKP